jgi:eukaryotic-like serine/threonine-protein kinase
MIGKQLLQYRIIDKLGAGGMGVVWLAIDTKLGREAALKMLPRELTGDTTHEQRFLREARSASALNHPNIITIYEINQDQGETFIAMEYVRGRHLHEIISGRLEPTKAAGYAIQIGEALAKAHAAGIVHRDLKPGNIMVTHDGLVKVLDFGLARTAQNQQSPRDENELGATLSNSITAPGIMVGTPAYMSPEQAIGDLIDARSDIFSFGIVLWEMLTGERPFRGQTQLDLLRAVLIEDLGAQGASGITEPWKGIVLKCLNKKREDRYQTAEAVMADLRRALEALPPVTSSLPAEPLEKMEGVNRRFGKFAATALVAGMAILAAGGSLWLWGRSRGGPSSQPSAAGTATPGSAFDLTRQARAALQRYDKDVNISNAIRMLEEAIVRDRGYAPGYAALGEAYVRRNSKRPDPEWLKRASEYAQKAVELNPDLAVSHVSAGIVFQQTGRRAEASVEFRKAVDLDPRNAPGLVGLAKVAAADGRKPEAETLFLSALQMDPSNWIPVVEYGIFQYTSARYVDAAKSFEHARDLTPDNVIIHRNLGAIYSKLDLYDDAASEFQRALEIEPSGSVYTNLGTIRFYQGRYLDAIQPMEKAVELLPNRYLNWGNLADAYRLAPGYGEKAAAAYRRAIQLAGEESAKAPDNTDIHGSLAMYLAHAGDFVTAGKEIGAVAQSKNSTPGSLFKSALAAETCGDRAGALRFLGLALSAGYSIKDVQSDPDLVQLRQDIRYHQIISKAEPLGRPRK